MFAYMRRLCCFLFGLIMLFPLHYPVFRYLNQQQQSNKVCFLDLYLIIVTTINQMKEKQSIKNLRLIRENLRIEANKAIRQIKNNQLLTLEEIREAEYLFDNIDEANQYMEKKNNDKKRNQQENKNAETFNKQLTKQKSRKTKEGSDKVSSSTPDNKLIRAQKKAGKSQKKNHDNRKKKKINASRNRVEQQDRQIDQNRNIISVQNNLMSEPPLFIFDQSRKWDEQLENEKKGKFQPEQRRILATSLSQYLVQNNIQLQDLLNSINASNESQKIPQNLKLWKSVCSVLPNRSLRSCYKYLMRKLRKKQSNIKWTQDQQQQLLALHQKYGSKWKKISRHLNYPPQNIRDKFRSLARKQEKGEQKWWKIQQLVKFFTLIEQTSKRQFLKQGIESVLSNAEDHNRKQQQFHGSHSYNSKFLLSHNIIEMMQYVDVDKFCRLDRNMIKWKSIAQQMQSRSETECKNKFTSFMEILNKDYNGDSQLKIIQFINQQCAKKLQFYEQLISWDKWNEQQEGFSSSQAKFKWKMIKKRVSNKNSKTFQQILKQAKHINQIKRTKCIVRQQRSKLAIQKKRKIISQRRQNRNKQAQQAVQINQIEQIFSQNQQAANEIENEINLEQKEKPAESHDQHQHRAKKSRNKQQKKERQQTDKTNKSNAKQRKKQRANMQITHHNLGFMNKK